MLSKTNLILFDDSTWHNLLPLTYTRPVSEIRVGISTIREKWLNHVSAVSYQTKDYLSEKYAAIYSDDNLFVNASLIPTLELTGQLSKLLTGELLVKDEKIIACKTDRFEFSNALESDYMKTEYTGEIISIENSWDIFEKNEQILRLDFERITSGRESKPISETNGIRCPEQIFIEEGAEVEFATINASSGPVYIGKDAIVQEGALIRGPLALGEHATIKMGAKIYGATTIGPWCKVSGEVYNSVLTGFSNKGHDGFLGNAVLGEWCNLGADTNNSNLKNNYASVKLWSYNTERFVDTGLQFCGLIMGDHSKCGINTMFNTGTVIGVSANIFGSGFPRNFIPSYSWGGSAGFSLYRYTKAMETAEIVMKRRNLELSEVDRNILKAVYDMTEKYRK